MSVADVVSLSAAECKALLAKKGYVYVDVRTAAEFAGGHAAGAVNLPFMFKDAETGAMVPNKDFAAQFAQAYPNKDEKLVLGCASGRRSMNALKTMLEEGYTGLIDLAGGWASFHALKPDVVSLSAAECKALLAKKGYVYVDVRTAAEFAGGHAAGAVNLPFMFKDAETGAMVPNKDFAAQFAQAYPNKDEKLVLGCASGRRSMNALKTMLEEGYTGLIDLAGGWAPLSALEVELVHVVLFKLKDDAKAIANLTAAMNAMKVIPFVKSLAFGPNRTTDLFEDYIDRTNGYTHSLSVVLRDGSFLKEYRDHELHKVVLDILKSGLLMEGGIMATDFNSSE